MIARPWTDDLPKCKNTCIASYLSGFGYNGDGNTDEQLCFYCQTEDNSCLYGVFEPHNGLDAARFIMQRMAAEILFPPPSPANTDDEIRDRLRNVFMSVEKAYIENYDGLIAERTSLHYQLQTLNENQIQQNCANILPRLKEIDAHLSAGVAVVLALVLNNKLYLASVGEARALLCRADENSVLRVVQLTADHSLENEDEVSRLARLGLDVAKLRSAQCIGNQTATRGLGNYLVKGLYKAFSTLSPAVSEPVTATPEIHGPIMLDDSCRFLVLVTSGVYKRLQDVLGNPEETNKHLFQIIVENFRKQNFDSVSASALKEVETEFSNHCTKYGFTSKLNRHMSMLIRNFNFIPPYRADTSNSNKNQVRFNPVVESKTHTLEMDGYSNNSESISLVDSNKSDSNSDLSAKQYDKDKRIKGYVDFSCYYEYVAIARKNGTLPSIIK